MIGILALLGTVSILLTALTVDTVLKNRLHQSIQSALDAEISEMDNVDLHNWHMNQDRGKDLHLEVEVRAARPVSHQEAVELQGRVAARLRRPVALVLLVTDITHLDPLIPPTPSVQISP